MKSVSALGALWAFAQSVSSTVIYSENSPVLPANLERHSGDLRVRSLPQTLGTFPLDATFNPGTLVIDITASPQPGQGGQGGTPPSARGSITASCAACYTNGTGAVTTDGVLFNDTVFQNPIAAAEEFMKDPFKLVEDAFETEIELDLSNFTGHFEFEIDFAGSGSYDVSVPMPITPLGGKLSLPPPAPSITYGLNPTIDILFTVTGKLATTIGFEFMFPKGASFKIDPIHGNLISTNFGDVQFKPLPISFKSGSGSAVVSLKVGATLSLDFHIGDGFTIEAGVYSDIPTYTALITAQPDAPCEVGLEENAAVDVGAYATAGVVLNGIAIGGGPSYVVTLATFELPSLCLVSSTPAAGLVTTTPSAAALTTSFSAKALATPITGPHVVGTPVVDKSSLGALPTRS